LLDDRIFLSGFEVFGSPENAVDVGFAVAAFGDEALRGAPAGGEKSGDVAGLKGGDLGAVLSTSELGDGG
jgi:hypothetical protein